MNELMRQGVEAMREAVLAHIDQQVSWYRAKALELPFAQGTCKQAMQYLDLFRSGVVGLNLAAVVGDEPDLTACWHAVVNEAGNEGVIFKDRRDARYALTGIVTPLMLGTSTLADAFRECYADGQMPISLDLYEPTKKMDEGQGNV